MLSTILKKALQENNIQLPESACLQLITYLMELKKWNKVFNLTRITDRDDMVDLHLIDSLLVASHLQGKRYLDVGSGAGFPGIPLAIMRPDTKWVLLDKCGKKTRFLWQMKAILGLNNITVQESRAEHFHTSEKFDSILSRALGSLRLFTESTQSLLAKEGVWLAMKGKYPHDELARLPSCVQLRYVKAYGLANKVFERHIVCLTSMKPL